MPTNSTIVAASASDCQVIWRADTSVWEINTTATSIRAGRVNANNQKNGAGMRFAVANIPTGITVTQAYITFTAISSLSTTTVNSKICGELNTNASVFSDIADYQARRGTDVDGANNTNRTTAEVSWNSIGAWTADSEYQSPDISTIIQEISDLGDITNLVLFWDDHAVNGTNSDNVRRAAYSYDEDTDKAPQLYVEYTVLDSTHTPQVTII